MFSPSDTFSSFSVDDVQKAEQFYGQTLGLQVTLRGEMGLEITLPHDAQAFAYPKADHLPATFTVLNFVVDDIDAAVEQLSKQGVTFERYEGMEQDDKGIARGRTADMGPDIAWFKDPAGNILAVLQLS